MANTVIIYAETGANMISDDPSPALNFSSTTNVGMESRGTVLVSTASVDIVNTPAIQTSSASGGLTVSRTVVGNMTTGVLRLAGNSVPSGSMLDITGTTGFASITSVVL